ncbi:hypothetical protein M407DRAFT_244881 [Tulasnella calospora MUT 4182]|uniref:Oxysterol-binding protein n=1 Tax=Tulasnella calospora MUT 4182 TaxID=1051891 RepID=A0A0C3Q3C7_9AGAM|nr:hypothetical protein M407DRAFT_244881 [Tulasnella calospora MUT 4182]
MGLFSNIQGAASAVTRGKRPSIDQPGGPGSGPADGPPPPGEDEETSVLDQEQGNIILAMISQLRPGMDLQKVSFPTFVLEPRSMLERITDFMSHPELVFGAENIPEPEERFVQVLSYYLSGWHIKPKGVKKPYNPVLGEIFRCRYEYPDGTKGFYIAEQVSHHPPISAYFYISPHNKVRIAGELRPKSRFLGNSVATMMEGENRVLLMGRPDDGEYVLGLPNMFARGILFGTMILELGDTTNCKNEATGMSCAVEFKTKGWMGGQYNLMAGKIKKNGTTEIGSIDGRWSHQLDYKDLRNGKQRVLFNASQQTKSMVQKKVAPENEQEPNESRRLWSKLTAAIANKDMEAAQAAKSEVEESQRALAREREAKGIVHKQRFFELRNGLWQAKIEMLEDPDEMVAAVEKWMWAPPPKD